MSWLDGTDAERPIDERLEQAADQAETDAWLRALYASPADVPLAERLTVALRARTVRRRRRWLLAAATVLGVAWLGWPARPPDPPPVRLAADCRLERYGNPAVRVLGPRRLRLDDGELRLVVDSGETVEVITPAGRVLTRGRTRVLVGAYSRDSGDPPMTPTLRTLVLAGSILMTSPMGSLTGHAGDQLAGAKGAAPRKVAQQHVGLALDLHRALAARAPQANLVVASHTVASALGLAYQGARGSTATELGRLLRTAGRPGRLQWEAARLAAALGQLDEALDRPAPAGHGRVRAAAAIWADRGLALRAGLADAAGRQRAGLFRVDLPTARPMINAWVAARTRDTVQEILAPGATRGAQLVLTSAIHFKGEWTRFFDKRMTQLRPWRRLDGSTVQATTMSHINSHDWPCRMFTAGGAPTEWESAASRQPGAFRAIEMPYKGGRFGLLCLMTSGHDRLPGLERWLTPARLDRIARQLEVGECELILPRLTLQTRADLRSALASLGAPTAFGPRGDFGGFTTDATPIPLLGVHHVATLKLDERGTEAGGATAIPASGDIPRSFRATQPFLFALRDRTTGAVLFLGRVCDPTVD